MTSPRPTATRWAFGLLLAIGVSCWLGAALSWAAFASFLDIGGSTSLGRFSCEACLRDGTPDAAPDWVGAALVAAAVLGAASWLTAIAGARRASTLLFWGFGSCVAAGLVALVLATEAGRAQWEEIRFVRGDSYGPTFSLRSQLVHTRCVALGFLLASASTTLLLATRRPPGVDVLVAAALGHVGAGVLGCTWFLSEPSPSSTELPVLVEQARACAGLAFVISAIVASIAAWRGSGRPPGRAQWLLLVTWVGLGTALRLATWSYDADMRAPPTLTPRPALSPSPSPSPRPWVTACTLARPAVSYERRSSGEVVVLPLPSPPYDGRTRGVLRIEADSLDRPMGSLQPVLRAAREAGVEDADLAVSHLHATPSPTFGTIRDRIQCVVRGRVADLLGAETYGEMLDRAGAVTVNAPPPGS